MHSQFGTAVTRFHNQIGSDFVFGDQDIQPIYSSNEYTPPPTQCNDFVSLIDLQYILKKLIGDAKPGGKGAIDDGPLQRRAIIALTFVCVARGGEVKFIDTTRFMYHSRLGCTDFVWTEMKTTNRYSMPVFPNKSTYESDVYHALGSWFLCEDGLHRSPCEQQGFGTFLFPGLHNIRNNSVTKKITNVIRGVLPKNMTAEMTNRYSAKSLRKGSITQLQMTPGLTLADICGRSGHSTGTNIDSYTDKRNVMLGLRGGKALAEWSDVNATVHVPRFECLFEDGGTMFIVSLAALRLCAASLIMYHNQLTADLPLNPITDKLLKVARESKIQNIGSEDCPEVVLNDWSTIIYKDFCSRNPELTPPKADLRELCATVGQVVAQMNTQSTVLHDLVQESHRRESAYQVMKDQASQLHNNLAAREVEVIRLQGMLAKQNSKIAGFK